MFGKRVGVYGFSVLLVMLLCSSVFALNTSDIQAVRQKRVSNKSALTAADRDVIKSFIRAGIDEMLLEEDAWEAINVRRGIVGQSGGQEMTPYRQGFVEIARDELKSALNHAGGLQDEIKKARAQVNLLVIAANLKSMEVSESGIGLMGSNNNLVQYWAVQAAASVEVAEQVKNKLTGNEELGRRIVSGLGPIVNASAFADTLKVIVEFADTLGTPEARGLLFKVADLRIAQYENWKVRYELVDAAVLSALGRQIPGAAADVKGELYRRFGQLYSYVIERYILGEKVLSTEQKRNLASVIVEVENTVVSKLTDRPEERLKKAVEDKKPAVLESERQLLLGSVTKAGQLSTKLGVNYGKSPSGDAITGPKSLKAPELPGGGA